MNLSLSAGPIRAGHKIHQPMGTAGTDEVLHAWLCWQTGEPFDSFRHQSVQKNMIFFNPENTVTSCTLSPTQAPLSPGVATTSNLQTEERFSMLPTLVK